MRCQNCNKFVGQEPGDPEIQDEDYKDGNLTATVRIVQTCAECSSDLKEATLDIEGEVDFCHDDGEEGEHTVTLSTDVENTDRSEGKGRYRKTFYGAQVVFKLTCSCGRKEDFRFGDDVAASGMDECQ